MNRDENQFYLEIMSQPQVLLDSLVLYKEDNFNEIRKIHDSFKSIQNIKKIKFIGMGTSYYASLIATHFFNSYIVYKNSAIDCESIDASEFLYNCKLSKEDSDTLVIFISQSGESGELIQILKVLNKQSFPKKNMWAITNTKKSNLDKKTDFTLFLNAGVEKTVTNKTYICTILTLNFLMEIILASRITELSGKNDINFEEIYHKIEKFTMVAISSMESYLQQWITNSKKLVDFISIEINVIPLLLHYLSRGTSLATAEQGALNTK